MRARNKRDGGKWMSFALTNKRGCVVGEAGRVFGEGGRVGLLHFLLVLASASLLKTTSTGGMCVRDEWGGGRGRSGFGKEKGLRGGS